MILEHPNPRNKPPCAGWFSASLLQGSRMQTFLKAKCSKHFLTVLLLQKGEVFSLTGVELTYNELHTLKVGKWWVLTRVYTCKCRVLLCAVLFWLFATPQAIAHQAPLPMGFSRQEHWNGLPHSPSGDLRHAGTEPSSLAFPALAGWFFTTSAKWDASAYKTIT